MFSSKSFIVSGLTFRSLIHFEFIFVYSFRKCSNFFLLHVAVQFFQHHLLKRLSFLHCIFSPPCYPPVPELPFYNTETDILQKATIFLKHWLKCLWFRTRIKNFTIYMETQKTLNSQSSLEKEEWSWRNQPSWLQIILQSYSHQDSMVLAQKQKYRPMKQDRKPRNKPMHLWVPYFWQRRQEYTMGQT